MKRLLLSTVLATLLSGCAYYFPPLHEERIGQYMKTCERIGFKEGTAEYSNCVLALETKYLSGSSTNIRAGNSNAQTQSMIDQDRVQRQILNHGAGGCTPNFATGGCL